MAADQIFPIVFKPGILRDRPPFQGEYCTDGQWIRFYGGMPKKMGGMTGIKGKDNTYFTNSIFKFNIGNNKSFVFFGYNDPGTLKSSVYKYVIYDGILHTTRIFTELKVDSNPLWQFIPVINSINGNPRAPWLVCFASNNLDNILDISAPYIRYIGLDNSNSTAVYELTNAPKDTNGGMVFINPYLFAYGNNGLVRWSKSKDAFDFGNLNTTENSVSISTDKVIFGAKVRGGNSPTLLFWTLSSVIKLSNSATGEGDELKMTKDVITSDSSILSSRCVIEYDGVFYWPGTGRFFIYNGIVNPLENNINRNYFFDNIDMNKRQLVFGVKNVAKDEIWWFYPEKGQDVNVGCTHAIIYNVIENSWYDTSISRDCGFWDNVTGGMYTFGLPLVANDQVGKIGYLWQHEVGVDQLVPAGNFTNPIPSSFTTPTISFASFNPLKQLTGIDRWMEVKKIEPDFRMDKPEDTMSVVINTKEYAQSPTISSEPIVFTGATPKIDYYYQGRQLTFTFASTNYFEMGHVMITVNIGDGQ
jgi:hypothetical protein